MKVPRIGKNNVVVEVAHGSLGPLQHLQKPALGGVQQHARDAVGLVVGPAPVQQGGQLGRAEGAQRPALVNEVIEVHEENLQKRDGEDGPRLQLVGGRLAQAPGIKGGHGGGGKAGQRLAGEVALVRGHEHVIVGEQLGKRGVA